MASPHLPSRLLLISSTQSDTTWDSSPLYRAHSLTWSGDCQRASALLCTPQSSLIFIFFYFLELKEFDSFGVSEIDFNWDGDWLVIAWAFCLIGGWMITSSGSVNLWTLFHCRTLSLWVRSLSNSCIIWNLLRGFSFTYLCTLYISKNNPFQSLQSTYFTVF